MSSTVFWMGPDLGHLLNLFLALGGGGGGGAERETLATRLAFAFILASILAFAFILAMIMTMHTLKETSINFFNPCLVSHLTSQFRLWKQSTQWKTYLHSLLHARPNPQGCQMPWGHSRDKQKPRPGADKI